MRALRNAGLVTGALIVGAAVAIALFAPLLVPHDPFAQDLSRRLIPPKGSRCLLPALTLEFNAPAHNNSGHLGCRHPFQMAHSV